MRHNLWLLVFLVSVGAFVITRGIQKSGDKRYWAIVGGVVLLGFIVGVLSFVIRAHFLH